MDPGRPAEPQDDASDSFFITCNTEADSPRCSSKGLSSLCHRKAYHLCVIERPTISASDTRLILASSTPPWRLMQHSKSRSAQLARSPALTGLRTAKYVACASHGVIITVSGFAIVSESGISDVRKMRVMRMACVYCIPVHAWAHVF